MSPGLLPLLVFPLSFVQLLHCVTMCGPSFVARGPKEKESYLLGRTISYAGAGALFGQFGRQLRELLEIRALGAVAFAIFLALTIILAVGWLGNGRLFAKFRFAKLPKLPTQSALIQGLLSVALPCSLLTQMFSLSVLSGSLVGGALIGLAHASTSSLGLWYGSKALTKLFTRIDKFQWLLKGAIFTLILLNLFYFAGVLLHSEEISKTKILFCF